MWRESTPRNRSKEAGLAAYLIPVRYTLGLTNRYIAGLLCLTFYSQFRPNIKSTLTNKKAARKRLLHQFASRVLATETYSATAAASTTSSTD